MSQSGPYYSPPDPMAALGPRFVWLQRQITTMKKRAYAMEAREKLGLAGRRARFPVEFRSQYGEDTLLWELFDGSLDGFFIEVGAFDGYNFAVTYALEAVGWKGLLVEPIPERFEQCKARRPGSRVVHAALGPKGSTGTTTLQVTADEHGGMHSLVDFSGQDTKKVQNLAPKPVAVPLTTMDALLDAQSKEEFGGRDIEVDAAILDVEGGELALLDGFDLERWKPKVILAEDNTMGRDPRLMRHLASRGYQPIAIIEVNLLCVRNDLAPLMRSRLEIHGAG